jgi:prepilin-type N-terminal cleavage/methylation domain-containing protein
MMRQTTTMTENHLCVRHRIRGHARGFSLIELMVALALGLIVSIAIVAFTMSSFRSNGQFVLATRLTQDLRNTMDLMTRDLRRAGYNQSALSGMGLGSASPFASLLLQSDCVIYAYDRKDSGTAKPGVLDLDNGEVRGLRRVVATVNNVQVGVIEYAESSNGEKPACDGDPADYTKFPPECNDDSKWCSLSDPSILNITGLTFTDNRSTVGTAPSQVVLRDIGVKLDGQLRNDTSFTRSVSTSVRVRSDCYDPTIGNCNVSP